MFSQPDPMTNARDELKEDFAEHKIDLSALVAADIRREVENDAYFDEQEDESSENSLYVMKPIILKEGHDQKELDAFWEAMNFEYYSGFGAQNVYGTIWLTENRWMTRGEYDGSEWWELHKRPVIPEHCRNIP